MSYTLDIRTIISFLALGVSVANLYLTYLRSGKIDVLPPRMCYFQYVQDTAFRPSIVLPLTFVNSGARIASVLNLNLNVEFVPENEGNVRNLRFVLVREYNTYPNPSEEGMAAQFSVKGYESVSKTFDFRLSNESLQLMQRFERGVYTINVEVEVVENGIFTKLLRKSPFKRFIPNFCIVVELTRDVGEYFGCALSRDGNLQHRCPNDAEIIWCRM